MAKKFVCSEIGMKCGYQVTANTTEELMPKIADHAKNAHGMMTVPDEIMAKIKSVIKEI
jgi:predicted small metal-binding protein